MVLGNYTAFRAKHVTGIEFGDTAISTAAMSSTVTGLAESYLAANASNLIDLTGDADTNNPTTSYAFAKDFSTSGNERSSSEEALLGADSSGSQNTELNYGNNSKIDVEFTCVYRNPEVTGIFNDSTKICLITMDNEESSSTGQLKMLFNNLVMTHVGSLSRNNDGLMEQKVKFSIRGGFASSEISCTDAPNTYSRYTVGLDYAEEILISTA